MIEQAIRAQELAADPAASVLVSANAGSGKTHVLINRVTRVLLAGALPEQILCVTYTKAAASEMLNRLFAHLGKFSILPDEQLRKELQKLDPDLDLGPAGLGKARRLFARALETPGGLKIRTIHGFCESLLRQFPIEAGLAPGFDLLDDQQGATLQEKLISAISKEAVNNPDGELGEAFEQLGKSGASTSYGVFETARANAQKLSADLLQDDGLATAIRCSAQALDLQENDTEQDVYQRTQSRFDRAGLQALITALKQGTLTQQKKAAKLAQALHEPDPAISFDILTGEFLKKDFCRFAGFPEKFLGKKIAAQMPELLNICLSIVENIEYVLRQVSAVKVLQNTKAALILCHSFISSYHQAKQKMGLIDFDDLIEYSRKLLGSNLSRDWVLYKLDGNLRHVLVDEAQDNSPAQWQVIGALTNEFFAGHGAQDETRTLFAVGDPKQSIYRFQGADPSLFLERKSELLMRRQNGQAKVHIPQMSLSWRSSPQVLQFVDACFANTLETKFAGDADDFNLPAKSAMPDLSDPGFADYLPHGAKRQHSTGSVTLLPPIPFTSPVADENPSRPVDSVSSTRPESLLAQDIAKYIKDMLDAGKPIECDKNPKNPLRPITGGDILILVRSRNNLFRELIRNLKLQSVPVAGADQMVLQDEISVLDLLSVAKIAIQPADDLSLAEVLAGPFLHPKAQSVPPISQQIIFELAHYRDKGQSLYSALMDSAIPELAEAKLWVSDLVKRAGIETPYRFFAGLLYRPSATSEPMIERLFARLGAEAEDPVQEFLGLALAFAKTGDGSLFSFVMEMQNREDTIKRELQASDNAVRVMTVHGAKGLEAPVVILPDTNKGSSAKSVSGLVKADAAWLWMDSTDKTCPAILAYRDQQELLNKQEHKRLLYVALTRARDHLLICGHGRGDNKKTGGFAPDSWYLQCQSAFEELVQNDLAKKIISEDKTVSFTLGEWEDYPETLRTKSVNPANALPNWVREPARGDFKQTKVQTPSSMHDDGNTFVPVSSPVGLDASRRFLRGNIIHALLQNLSELSDPDREAAAIRFLEQEPDLQQAEREEIRGVTMKVLSNPEFADLFGPDSRAEVPVAGTLHHDGAKTIVNGKIDRLVIGSSEIIVLDFKTNRPPPTVACNIPAPYIAQMATYRALLRQIWPQKQIRCALLWTDGPNLMQVPDELMDKVSI